MTIKLGRLGIAAAVLGMAGGTSSAMAEDGLLDYVEPIVNARLRYEYVDQNGFSNDANAVTARARIGAQTKPIYGFSVLAEGEFTGGLTNDFNSTTNGRTAYPVVADPDNDELNRLQISYGSDYVDATVGRQRIIFDNARFVGNVGWRQNEQTFDAAMGTVKPFTGVSATYAYVNRVQTIFGTDSANADYEGDTQFIHLGYSGLDWLDAVAYAYLVDLDDRAVLSSQSYGARAVATFGIEENTDLIVIGEYANQSDYGSNPNDFTLGYYHGSVGMKRGPFAASAAFEILGGDGTVGFSTPLATLHKFQGWADVFLATPASGIRDVYAQVGYGFGEAGPFKKVLTTAVYHTFDADEGGGSLGQEIDLSVKGVLTPKLAITAKFASYDGPSGGPASRQKLWLQVDWAY